ncbi:MAG: nicotinamidase [Gemmatimonadetes bacterium]|nr:nicotinamidase [Gemmatimonadota bacterium]
MRIGEKDGLIIVDVQNDFCPGGALGVEGGDELARAISDVAMEFRTRGGRVYATQDWHPPGHCSFEENGGPWAAHCVQGTDGAEFHPDLRLPIGASIIRKGADKREDALSGFEGTDLEEQLTRMGIRRVFVGGIATEYCVLSTVVDAARRGFETYVLTDLVRAIEQEPGDGEKAVARMKEAGAKATSSEVMLSSPGEA